jgi:hypothetical protein
MGKEVVMNRTKRALGVAGALATCAVVNVLARGWYLHWGATAEEESAALPGDPFAPRITSTRAITMDAPVEKV